MLLQDCFIWLATVFVKWIVVYTSEIAFANIVLVKIHVITKFDEKWNFQKQDELIYKVNISRIWILRKRSNVILKYKKKQIVFYWQHILKICNTTEGQLTSHKRKQLKKEFKNDKMNYIDQFQEQKRKCGAVNMF